MRRQVRSAVTHQMIYIIVGYWDFMFLSVLAVLKTGQGESITQKHSEIGRALRTSGSKLTAGQ